MSIDLSGKTAIVTGSTAGIGLAIAKGLATAARQGRRQRPNRGCTGRSPEVAAAFVSPNGQAPSSAAPPARKKWPTCVVSAASPQASATTGAALRVDGGVVDTDCSSDLRRHDLAHRRGTCRLRRAFDIWCGAKRRRSVLRPTGEHWPFAIPGAPAARAVWRPISRRSARSTDCNKGNFAAGISSAGKEAAPATTGSRCRGGKLSANCVLRRQRNAYLCLPAGRLDGRWSWQFVLERLNAAGHDARALPFRGVGERAAELSPACDNDLFLADTIATLEKEDLRDIVLVGHSFGSLIASLVRRGPERIGHLVIIDGGIAQDGQSIFGRIPPEIVAKRKKLIKESTAPRCCPSRQSAA